MTATSGAETLLDRHDALLVDLDGVVYRGSTAVPHAVESLTSAVAAGLGPDTGPYHR